MIFNFLNATLSVILNPECQDQYDMVGCYTVVVWSDLKKSSVFYTFYIWIGINENNLNGPDMGRALNGPGPQLDDILKIKIHGW